MGDFNTCLLKGDNRSIKLEAIIEACNMQILPLSATHNFPNSTPSLLDLIMVSSSNLVFKHGQCPADAFSYHDLIFLSYKLRPPKIKPKLVLRRNFGGMDIEQLCEDAYNIDWSVIERAPCIDDKVELFCSLLTQLYDVHAPMHYVRLKHLPAPWLSDDLKKLILQKNAALSKLKRNKTEENVRKYAKIRNRCNTLCRDAQRRHIHTSVENGDSSRVWKFLKTVGVGRTSLNTSPPSVDFELLNQHFSNPSNSFDSEHKLQTLRSLSVIPTPNYPPFVFSQFTECDVKKTILSISSNAAGSDNISRNMIVPLLDVITPIITYLLNACVSSSKFPQAWKSAHIIPLPKKSNPVNLSDFRPISILPFLSKVLEKLICQQLTLFLNKHNLLNSLQSGFRPGHSTATALIKVTDDIRWGMDNKQLTVMTLLDFSNAFNTVDFDILLSLLCSLNISPSVIDWFQSYLCGRRQCIRVDETHSSWCDITAGVPQGGVLSPLLFSIFINSITHKISSLYHMYADDVQIYTQSTLENLPNAIATLNKDLNFIHEWSKSYGLNVNPKKSQAIIIGSQSFISRIDWFSVPPIVFDGVVIPYFDNVKNLGIYIDNSLNWIRQLNEVSKKTFVALCSLRRLRSFLPIPTKIMLAQSLLLPILDYADASYVDITEDQLNKLERLQNTSIRFIFGLRKFDHISQFRSRLKWLPIRLRRNMHILSILYCVLFHPSTPPYLKEKFNFVGLPGEPLRSSRKFILSVPTHNTSFFNKSFTVQSIKLWNALPLHIREAQTIVIFKRLLKEHYLFQSFGDR
ncbi:unnamed protein product [Parnassius mnemosyne]|uniref:Reverse transcriptase domain-containing protein n=1 Tax=Parnassius mnemosyne TaxID=213953 RepID=A0AAV1L5M9_9NEOP